jgi:hypothetical protein
MLNSLIIVNPVTQLTAMPKSDAIGNSTLLPKGDLPNGFASTFLAAMDLPPDTPDKILPVTRVAHRKSAVDKVKSSPLSPIVGAKTFRTTLKNERENKGLLVLEFEPGKIPTSPQPMSRAELLEVTRSSIRNSRRKSSLDDSRVSTIPDSPNESRGMAVLKSEHYLQARDLRQLETAFAVSNEPAIEVRQHCILVNADPIRAVLLREKCLLLVPDERDELQIARMMRKRLQECAGDASYSFEFKCMEALLMTLMWQVEEEWAKLQPDVQRALADLLQSQMKLEECRQVKNRVATFEVQVGGLRQGLMKLLNHEEDLCEIQEFCADR